jgi:hypothetical protein
MREAFGSELALKFAEKPVQLLRPKAAPPFAETLAEPKPMKRDCYTVVLE